MREEEKNQGKLFEFAGKLSWDEEITLLTHLLLLIFQNLQKC